MYNLYQNSNNFVKKIINNIVNIVFYGIIFYLLFSLLTYINQNLKFNSLYMDDLYFWSFFGEGESFKEFCFPVVAKTYRPIYWILSYIQFYFTKSNVDLYYYYNLFLNSFIALTIFHFSTKLSNSKIVGIVTAFLYATSYYSYYQIGQMMGVLESYSLLFGIIIVYNLVQFLIKEEKYIRNIITAGIFYFLVIFTHERYIGLFIPIFFALCIKYFVMLKKNILYSCIIPLSSVISFVIIRHIKLGTFIPTGTARQDVVSNFSINSCLNYAIDQVNFLFGFNQGVDYLSAHEYDTLAINEKQIIIHSFYVLLILVIIFIVMKIANLIKNKKLKQIWIDFIFLVSIAMMIASASVTIRIEMRWIYISFAICLLYLSYLSKEVVIFYVNYIKEKIANNKIIDFILLNIFRLATVLLFVLFLRSRVKVDILYRNYYPNIYFMEDQTRMNNLANMTVYKYGVNEFIGKKNVYILENKYNMSDFYAEWFYRPYKYGWDGSGTRVYFINNISELPKDEIDNAIVLKEDPANRTYTYVDIEKEDGFTSSEE